ncbi:uncharacterized protein FIBRA_09143 [Fibroporia radiculosa]|uniref:Uncharacterized protein n=1 Tax=Fibroporia radiculosa TaxID=599839 RepID=J4GY09_9APHY|nr:uncharacterized protein FIBRA_09143 [Fibroporia radiculosa]CCM06840.1 predicted protein [Fibroporia radiculosa]
MSSTSATASRLSTPAITTNKTIKHLLRLLTVNVQSAPEPDSSKEEAKDSIDDISEHLTSIRSKGGVLPKDMAEAVQNAVSKVKAIFPDLPIRFGTIIPKWTWAKNARECRDLEARIVAKEAELARIMAEEAKLARIAAEEAKRIHQAAEELAKASRDQATGSGLIEDEPMVIDEVTLGDDGAASRDDDDEEPQDDNEADEIEEESEGDEGADNADSFITKEVEALNGDGKVAESWRVVRQRDWSGISSKDIKKHAKQAQRKGQWCDRCKLNRSVSTCVPSRKQPNKCEKCMHNVQGCYFDGASMRGWSKLSQTARDKGKKRTVKSPLTSPRVAKRAKSSVNPSATSDPLSRAVLTHAALEAVRLERDIIAMRISLLQDIDSALANQEQLYLNKLSVKKGLPVASLSKGPRSTSKVPK